jgi:hypothetical protein
VQNFTALARQSPACAYDRTPHGEEKKITALKQRSGNVYFFIHDISTDEAGLSGRCRAIAAIRSGK